VQLFQGSAGAGAGVEELFKGIAQLGPDEQVPPNVVVDAAPAGQARWQSCR